MTMFQRQDHTLGHLLQAWIDQNLVGRDKITFAGYDIPHPLRDEMVLRIGVRDNSQSTAIRVFKQATRALSNMFASWAKLWEPYVAIRNSSNSNSNTSNSNSNTESQTSESYESSNSNSSSNESSATPTPPPAPIKKTASRPSIFAKLAKEAKQNKK